MRTKPTNEPNRVRLTDQYIRRLPTPDRLTRHWDDLQRGLCLEVTPTGHRVFKVTYRCNGLLRWFVLDAYGAIGLANARDAARKVRARAMLGEDPHAEKMQKRQALRAGDTLAEVHDRYVQRHARRHNKSWEQGKRNIERYVLPTLGKKPIHQIERRHIRELFETLTIEKEAPVAANAMLAALSAVLVWAVDQELIPANPATGLKRNKVGASERFLSDEEIERVWPAVEDLGLYKCMALRLILLTGQRPGEVCSMRWQDIDLERGVWTLAGEPAEGWVGTKNGKTHEVPLSEPVLAILKDGAGIGPVQAKGNVFPRRRGWIFPIPKTQRVWTALSIPRFRPHDLRATAATGMDRLGISKAVISRALNHTEGGITERYIRHDAMEQKRAALDAWAEHVMGVVEGRAAADNVVRLKRGA